MSTGPQRAPGAAVRPTLPQAGARQECRHRWLVLPCCAAAAALLFTCYLRLSWTVPDTSDGAAIALQAWDMLHGNVLLHGWTVGDVSFYTTELPEYIAVEAVRGLGPGVVHIAAALTYTLLVLLAGLLAKGRATGREGLTRVLIASGIMLAPQLGHGAFLLLLNPDHTGTQVPLLVAWLVLDRAPRRWWVPVIVGLLLTWVQVADRVAVVTAVVPLILVCAVRALRSLVRRRAPSAYELSLAAAAIASAGVAWLAGRGITTLGGFTAHPLPTTLAPPNLLPVHLRLTGLGLLALYGAEFHRPGPALIFAVAHLVGLALALCAFLLALWRFPREQDLVVQVLTAAIVVNLVTYIFSILPGTIIGTGYPTREIAAVLPLGAVLAGRLLAGPLLAPHALPQEPPSQQQQLRRRPRHHLAALTPLALAACGAAYLAAFGYGAAQSSVPAMEQDLADWLAAHHLSGGLGSREGNVTMLDSSGRVRLMVTSFWKGGAAPYAYQSKASWYDPALNYANFVVTTVPEGPPSNIPYGDVVSTFGPPSRTYHFGDYTIVVWDKNLLADLRAPYPS